MVDKLEPMYSMQASEAVISATYVDNYLDSVENLPDDVQRYLSRIRDIDVLYRNSLRDVDHYYDLWHSLQNAGETSTSRRQRAIKRMHQRLVQAQELGDEKMQLVSQMQELIDQKTRQLDSDKKKLDLREDLPQHRLDQFQATDEYGAATSQKQPRLQSPSCSGDQILGTGSGGNSMEIGGSERFGGSLKDIFGTGNNSTPNSERGGYIGGSAANGCLTSGALLGGEAHRSAGKRSRRRNESMISNLELGGNESNSATEGGSGSGGIGGGGANDRGSSHRAGNASGSHKRNSSQHQNTTGGAAGGGSGGSTGSGGGSGVGGAGGNSAGKKKKRKARNAVSASAQVNAHEETPPPDAIDPDEPTYCVCNQISYGEMILCDNDLCPIEWFHFSCVSLVFKPKGKWFCPNCRGDRPNVMKPKAQFLKELERYNKEKEEKT